MTQFLRSRLRLRALPSRLKVATAIAVLTAGGAVVWLARTSPAIQHAETEVSSQSKRPRGIYHPTPSEWAALAIETPEMRMPRAERTTEGKIAVDEDRSTPIFSPYAGRVTTLFVKHGDTVVAGQPLFTVEATDMVQAQNEFIAGLGAVNKARAALDLATINEKRQRLLFEGKAVPLKEVQQARATHDAAENDVQSAEVAFEAARNKLRLLGKSDEEIASFQHQGTIDPATLIRAPFSGTVIQRRVGPGQYVSSGASDPVFVIGDLSTVWLVAFVRELEVPKVKVGQPVLFTVLAQPGRSYTARISFVGTGLDPVTRRLMVRATVDNSGGQLKPEMFASVDIQTRPEDLVLAVPRDSVILDGSGARIWVVRDEEKAIELRRIRVGSLDGGMVEVREGLAAGERIVGKAAALSVRGAGI